MESEINGDDHQHIRAHSGFDPTSNHEAAESGDCQELRRLSRWLWLDELVVVRHHGPVEELCHAEPGHEHRVVQGPGRVKCVSDCCATSRASSCGHSQYVSMLWHECRVTGHSRGWGERLSTPQVLWLRQRRPCVLRRKKDCTPALFLTSSATSSSMSLCSSEEGLAPLPSSSRRQGVLRRRRDRPFSSQRRCVLRRRRDRPSSSQCRFVPRGEKDRPSPPQRW